MLGGVGESAAQKRQALATVGETQERRRVMAKKNCLDMAFPGYVKARRKRRSAIHDSLTLGGDFQFGGSNTRPFDAQGKAPL
jgi:hypothetical protein